MAFISTEKVSQIRKNLKAAFPDWKFSLRKENHSAIILAVVKAPINVWDDYNPVDKYKDPHNVYEEAKQNAISKGYADVNHHWLKHSEVWSGKTKKAFNKIVDICMEGNHDNSDIMTDYFDVGWYFTMSVGKWDKAVELPSKD